MKIWFDWPLSIIIWSVFDPSFRIWLIYKIEIKKKSYQLISTIRFQLCFKFSRRWVIGKLLSAFNAHLSVHVCHCNGGGADLLRVPGCSRDQKEPGLAPKSTRVEACFDGCQVVSYLVRIHLLRICSRIYHKRC